jgi:large subunit ribosomal protein L5e
MYKQNTDITGDYFNVDDDVDSKRPFKAHLDVGITRTTTGARVFGALKGACDGGLNVPHKVNRFPGYSRGKVEQVVNKRGKAVDTEKTAANFDAKVHRNHIFGLHVTAYMNKLKKEEPEKYKRTFSQWDKCLTAAKVKTCEELYKKVHEAIIKNPDRVKAKGNAKPTKKVVTPGPARVFQNSKGKKWLRHFKLTGAQRKERVQ